MKETLEKAEEALKNNRPGDCIQLAERFISRSGPYASEGGQVKAFSLLARAHWEIDNKNASIGYWHKTIAAIRNLNDERARDLKSGFLCILTQACQEAGQLESALEAGLRAVEAARELRSPDPERLGLALLLLSSVWLDLKDLQKAEGIALEAKEIWEKAGNLEKVADCMNRLASIYEVRGDRAGGIRWREKAVSMLRLMLCEEDLASSLYSLSLAKLSLRQWREAEDAVLEAKEIWEKAGNLEKVANCMEELASIYALRGDKADAIPWREKAVSMRRLLLCEEDLASALLLLGLDRAVLSQWRKAEEATLEAKEIWEKAGNLEKVADCMEQLASIYEWRGDKAEGIPWREKAVSMRRLLLCDEKLAASLDSLGNARVGVSQYEHARKNFVESQQIYLSLGKQDSPEMQQIKKKLDSIPILIGLTGILSQGRED